MAFFKQGKDTIEWQEFRSDVLFYKWKNTEIKKGSKLIIRPGQKAIFYANGRVEGIFEEEGSFDIASDIVPFLSTLKGVFELRGDSGLRAEVYFVNSKELLMNWGTRQRIMIPTTEVPGGIPIGMNGNLIVVFRDYLTFIEKVAGVKSTYSLNDISERIMGDVNSIIAEAILEGHSQVGVATVASLQQNNRKISKYICEELDKELLSYGLGVEDVNIVSVSYPPEVQEMAEKVAAQAFVGDIRKYAAISAADGMSKGGGDVASLGAQIAVGAELAKTMSGALSGNGGNGGAQGGDRFCTKCRKMVSSKFCPDCGTETV